MSTGKDDGPALRYHLQTSYDRWSLEGHSLDWNNQPAVFKEYPAALGLRQLALEAPPPEPHGPSLQDVLYGGFESTGADEKDVLVRVLRLAVGLTARSRSLGATHYYRSAASAGALYPVEVYLATCVGEERRDTPCPPGVYHYNPLRHVLVDLGRPEGLRELCAACSPPHTQAAWGAFVLSAIFYRSAWKYRDRAYRYCLLDTGHVLENVLLAARSMGAEPCVRYDFDDTRVNRILGVDADLEAALAVVFLQRRGGLEFEPDAPGEMDGEERPLEVMREASRMTRREVHYQDVAAMHQAGALVLRDQGACGLSGCEEKWERMLGRALDFKPVTHTPPLGRMGVRQAMVQRRSKRNFIPVPMPSGAIAGVVQALCAKDPEPSRPDGVSSPLAIALAAQHAGGMSLAEGLYALCRANCSLARLHAGSVQDALARACLGQEWLKNAGLLCLFTADIDLLEREYGARAYRYALLEAGRLGQRTYLAATEAGLGACGVGAFFDQEASTIIGIGRRGQLLYLVAAGAVRS